MQLISLHNVYYLIHLLRGLREAVINETAGTYAIDFFTNYYSTEEEGVPGWIKRALKECDIELP